MQAGRVKAGEPHVAHDHDLEGVLDVLELVRQLAALFVPPAQLRQCLQVILGAFGLMNLTGRSAKKKTLVLRA